MKPMLWILALTGAIAGTACKGGARSTDEAAQPAGQQGMGSMAMDSMPMGDNHPGMAGSSMMPRMRAHMDSITRTSPSQMSGMVAAHDQLMSQMMDGMGADMRSMHMSGDAKWNALTDSVKADLADLPALQGKELATRMKAHADRVRRLISLHEGMIKGM